MAVNGVALGAVAVGSVFTYAGIKGISVTQALQYIVQGKSPAAVPVSTGIDTPAASSGASGDSQVGGGSATGQAIANDALKYQGTGYVYGGRADKPGNWDCSSFVSYVLGHDLGMNLPGGHYGAAGFPPHVHGPTTGTYQSFGAKVTQAQVAAGDLLVWSDHMGIAISNTMMISAHSPTLGTGTSSIESSSRYHHGTPNCRRVGT